MLFERGGGGYLHVGVIIWCHDYYYHSEDQLFPKIEEILKIEEDFIYFDTKSNLL